MDDISELQGDILDAALAPEDWCAVLDKINRRFDASGCDLYMFRNDELVFSAGAGLDVSVPEYIERFIDREPRSLALSSLPTGEIITDLTLATRSTLKTSDYYAEFLPRFGLSGCIAGSVINTRTHRAYLGIHFPTGRWEFDRELLAGARRLQPMLARAVNLQFRLAGANALEALRQEAFERVPQGLLGLDELGRVLLANASAEAALADRAVFQVRNGRLQCVDTGDQARLDGLLAAARTRVGEQGGALLVGRGANRYSLLITPARTESRDEGATFVLIFLTRIGVEHPEENEAQFRALFALTATEARVAAHLLRGRSLREIATHTHTSYESVRFVVKQIFAKLEVHTQVELVALLSEALHRLPPAGRHT